MKRNLTILLLLLITFSLHSQDRYKTIYPYKVILGMNIIDDSFSTIREIIDVDSKLNIAAYPSYFGFGVLISDNFSLEGSVTINKYKVGNIIDESILKTEKEYYAIDASLKYDLSDVNYNLGICPRLTPYLIGGMGLTSIGDEVRPTINYGVGTYLWFSLLADRELNSNFLDNMGLFIQAHGKSIFKEKFVDNEMQYSLGLVYRFQ